MVLDKVHARARGPKTQLTRQPSEGRANQGGQRFGEMEKDALLASGASYALDDRSRIASDGHSTTVCSKCGQVGDSKTIFSLDGLLGTGNIEKSTGCRICNGAMVPFDTLYCWGRLFLLEQATTGGIKVAHMMDEMLEDTMVSSLENLDL